MAKGCGEIVAMFESLNSLTAKEWRLIAEHVAHCSSCKVKVYGKLAKGESGGKYAEALFLTAIVKMRNLAVRDEGGNILNMHECARESELIASFKKGSLENLSPEEWEEIFEHNSACEICRSINDDFGQLLRSTLTGSAKKDVIN